MKSISDCHWLIFFSEYYFIYNIIEFNGGLSFDLLI